MRHVVLWDIRSRHISRDRYIHDRLLSLAEACDSLFILLQQWLDCPQDLVPLLMGCARPRTKIVFSVVPLLILLQPMLNRLRHSEVGVRDVVSQLRHQFHSDDAIWVSFLSVDDQELMFRVDAFHCDRHLSHHPSDRQSWHVSSVDLGSFKATLIDHGHMLTLNPFALQD